MERYVLALSLLLASTVQAGTFELLSTAAMESATAEGGGDGDQAVSADGSWIAFSSSSGNLAAGQRESGTYPYPDVFLHNRQTGATVLVSHAAGSSTLAANYISNRPSISADGRWVAYLSRSGAIVPGQNPDPFEQVFLYDRDTGTNTLVTHSAAGPLVESAGTALGARVSADGGWVVFEAIADDLIPGLSASLSSVNIFLYERATGQITLVSRAAAADTTLTAADEQSRAPSLSGDGRYVAFQSRATDLIAGFSGGSLDWNAYLFDRVTGAMTLVSRSASSATQGASGKEPVISADGSSVAFLSFGTSLVAGQTDTNGGDDAFLFNRATGTNVLVSRSPASPTQTGNRKVESSSLAISATGAHVAFAGPSSVAGEGGRTFPTSDVFVFERATSSLTLASHASASPATPGSHDSGSPAISADGRYVAFHSQATDLVAGQVDPVLFHDVFLFDRTTGTTTLVSSIGGSSGQVAANALSWYPRISADGAVVAYSTSSKSVIAGAADFNSTADIVLYDRAAGTSSFATTHGPGMASATAGHFSMLSSASADGRYAVLVSWAENLASGQVDGNEGSDVFLVDRLAGTATLVSRSAASASTAANRETASAAISADGNWIVFNSIATDLVPGQVDTAESPDVFLYERATGTVTLMSHPAGSATTAGDLPCGYWEWTDGYLPGELAISADGRYVAFDCAARNLVAGQTETGQTTGADVFLHDRVTGQTSLVSRTPGSAVTTGNNISNAPRISADGRWIAFTSFATDLVAGADGNGGLDVFLHDRDTGQTLLVSRAADTADIAASAADGWSERPALSADGRHVAFVSEAANLVPGQTEGTRPTGGNQDIFLFDRVTGTVELISRMSGSATATADDWSGFPAVSADGLLVAFFSRAGNLLPGQTGPAGGVFVHDRTTRRTELISHSGVSRTAPLGVYGDPVLSPDGRYVAFVSGSLYIADRQLGTLERVAGAADHFSTGYSATALSLPVFGTGSTGSTVFFNSSDPSLTGSDFNNNFDVFAWVPAAPAGSDLSTVAPCRLADTRQSSPGAVSGQTSLLDVHGACGVPETATAVAVNVTVLQSTGSGRLVLHPGNVLAPGTSTINFAANQTLANNAILPLAFNGEGTLAITPFVIGGGTVHVIVDVSGYFEQEP